MKLSFRKLFFFLVFCGLVMPVFGMTIREFEEEVWRLTNAQRRQHSLPALQYDNGLADLARIHSNNMVKHSFFAHTDHLGDDVASRQPKYYPALIVISIGENLGKFSNSARVFTPQELVTGWMNSPHHRENILNLDYTHLGVGIVLQGNTLYATQNFAAPLVKLRSNLPKSMDQQRIYRISFQYMGAANAKDLNCTLIYPDPEAAYQISDDQEMVGAQPLKIDWQDKNNFSLLVPFLAGKGDYKLCFGFGGGYYPDGVVLRAR